jgi:hypothetical protein
MNTEGRDGREDRPGGARAEATPAGKGRTEDKARAGDEARAGTSPPPSNYSVEAGGICRSIVVRDGVLWLPVCNFGARIVREIVRDDGVERSLRFVIEGKTAKGQELPSVEVSAEEFARGDWPLVRWGRRAVVCAGQGNRDHLRAAIQELSHAAASAVVYEHLGWRKVDGKWAYLHAGGAIGADGPRGLAVELPDALRGYSLPAPPEGPELILSIRAALGLLDRLAPDGVMMPLLALAVRAVLPSCTVSGFLVGRTGVFKTELAALVQRFFGAGMDAAHLAASWASTANALEATAFACKDALLAIDDFAPRGSQADVARYHQAADRVFRGVGNQAGRQRLRPDGTLRPVKPPRATVLATGETLPTGHSVLARLLAIEVAPGAVKDDRLTACQHDAEDGRYAAVMSAYLARLAPRYEEFVAGFRERSLRLREELSGSAAHRRVPAMLGELLAAFELFLEFCVGAGAVDLEQSRSLRSRCRKALLRSARRQDAHQAASDPVERFLELVASSLASGRAHVAAPDGLAPVLPHDPAAWGWRCTREGEWLEQGRRIGWLDGDDLLLDPGSAYAEANKLAQDHGEAIGVGPDTLYRRVKERRLLVGSEKGRNTARRVIGGVRRRVLHIRASLLEEGGPSGPTGPNVEKQGGNGPVSGTTSRGAPEGRATGSGHFPAGDGANGPLGPVGPLPGEYGARPCAATDHAPRRDPIDRREPTDPAAF